MRPKHLQIGAGIAALFLVPLNSTAANAKETNSMGFICRILKLSEGSTIEKWSLADNKTHHLILAFRADGLNSGEPIALTHDPDYILEGRVPFRLKWEKEDDSFGIPMRYEGKSNFVLSVTGGDAEPVDKETGKIVFNSWMGVFGDSNPKFHGWCNFGQYEMNFRELLEALKDDE